MGRRIKTTNELDLEIARREGGKVNLTIAQIKEVRRHLEDIVFASPMLDVHALLSMMNKNAVKRARARALKK